MTDGTVVLTKARLTVGKQFIDTLFEPLNNVYS